MVYTVRIFVEYRFFKLHLGAFFLDFLNDYAILLLSKYKTYGPFVYRLGHNVFNVGSGVRLPVGSQTRASTRSIQKQLRKELFLSSAFIFKIWDIY